MHLVVALKEDDEVIGLRSGISLHRPAAVEEGVPLRSSGLDTECLFAACSQRLLQPCLAFVGFRPYLIKIHLLH